MGEVLPVADEGEFQGLGQGGLVGLLGRFDSSEVVGEGFLVAQRMLACKAGCTMV